MCISPVGRTCRLYPLFLVRGVTVACHPLFSPSVDLDLKLVLVHCIVCRGWDGHVLSVIFRDNLVEIIVCSACSHCRPLSRPFFFLFMFPVICDVLTDLHTILICHTIYKSLFLNFIFILHFKILPIHSGVYSFFDFDHIQNVARKALFTLIVCKL